MKLLLLLYWQQLQLAQGRSCSFCWSLLQWPSQREQLLLQATGMNRRRGTGAQAAHVAEHPQCKQCCRGVDARLQASNRRI